METKTAIVLGATGLVGRHLVAQLVDAPHISKVIIITRRPIALSSDKLVVYQLNFDTIKEYGNRFAGDILFSCLGTTRNKAGSIAAQRKVDLDLQYQCAQIAFNQGVSELFLVSSSGANSESQNAYLQMKGELEEKIGYLGFNTLNIFQPSLLLGERKEFRAGERIASAMLPLLCKIPALSKYRPIHAAEVARKMVQVSRTDGDGVNIYRLDDVFPSE